MRPIAVMYQALAAACRPAAAHADPDQPRPGERGQVRGQDQQADERDRAAVRAQQVRQERAAAPAQQDRQRPGGLIDLLGRDAPPRMGAHLGHGRAPAAGAPTAACGAEPPGGGAVVIRCWYCGQVWSRSRWEPVAMTWPPSRTATRSA